MEKVSLSSRCSKDVPSRYPKKNLKELNDTGYTGVGRQVTIPFEILVDHQVYLEVRTLKVLVRTLDKLGVDQGSFELLELGKVSRGFIDPKRVSNSERS